jgi:Helitron helicase-like domain at N-terminus
MTRRSDAVQVSHLLQDLDISQVTRVIARERNRSFFKDPTLSKIMKLTSVANSHVKGSREEIAKRRAEIRGENIRFGSSKFFITVNPDDMKHILILGLCGDEEMLWWKSGSDSDFNRYLQSRFKLVAKNPVLQAQFFDIIMTHENCLGNPFWLWFQR